MDATISANSYRVTSRVFVAGDGSSILSFEEREKDADPESVPHSDFSIHLPARMSACASMIAAAFNAHMRDDAATVDAQTAPSVRHRPFGVVARHRPFVPFPTGGSGVAEQAEDFAASVAVEGSGFLPGHSV